MFLLKKLVSRVFFPVPLSLELLLLGVFLLWFTTRKTTGKVLVTLGTIVLFVASTGIMDSALYKLERTYETAEVGSLPQEQNMWIVILGGGHSPDKTIPLASRLSDSSLYRVVEGVRLYNSLPGSRLLVSGGRAGTEQAEGVTMAAVAYALGVPPQSLIVDSQSKDTKDQARAVAGRIPSKRFILVTSASHMKRAVGMMRKAGLDPVPAPVGHRVAKLEDRNLWSYFPSADKLDRSERLTYEIMGLAWAELRGQI